MRGGAATTSAAWRWAGLARSGSGAGAASSGEGGKGSGRIGSGRAGSVRAGAGRGVRTVGSKSGRSGTGSASASGRLGSGAVSVALRALAAGLRRPLGAKSGMAWGAGDLWDTAWASAGAGWTTGSAGRGASGAGAKLAPPLSGPPSLSLRVWSGEISSKTTGPKTRKTSAPTSSNFW